MNNYYELTAVIDGEKEVLFGSFDKSEVTYEKQCESESLRAQGYKSLKIELRQTNEQPDADIYGNTTCEKLVILATNKGYEVTVYQEGEQELERSNNAMEIINSIKSVDCISNLQLIKDGQYVCTFAVCLDDLEPEETIIDYTITPESELLYNAANKLI